MIRTQIDTYLKSQFLWDFQVTHELESEYKVVMK